MSDSISTTPQSLRGVIARGVGWLFFNSVVNKFSGVATSLLKITHLTMFQYGLLTLTVSAVWMVNGIVNIGLQEFVIVDLNKAKGQNDMRAYKSLLVGFMKSNVVLAVAGWALLFFGSAWIASFYHNDIWRYLRLFSFMILVSPFVNLYLVILRTHLQFKTVTWWSVTGSYLNLALIIVLVVVFDQGIYGVLWAELLYHFLLLMLFAPFVYKHGAYLFTIKRRPGNSIWLHVRDHGKWAMMGNLFSDFSQRLRPWLITFFLSVEAVAVYSVAVNLFSHLQGVAPISKVMAEVFPQHIESKEKLKGLYVRSVKYGLVMYLALGFASIWAVPLFVMWFFPQYVESLLLFFIILMLLPFQSVGTLQNSLLYSLRLQKGQFIIKLLQSVSIIVFSIILLQLFGLIGAAIEFVVGGMLVIVMRYWYLLKKIPYMRIDPKVFFEYDTVDKELVQAIKQKIKEVVFVWRPGKS